MSLEDNINYLKGQEKIIDISIKSSEKTLSNIEKNIDIKKKILSKIRKEIRILKKELIQDERIPSSAIIEEKVMIKDELDKINYIEDEILEYIEDLHECKEEWIKVLKDEKKLPSGYFSDKDIEILNKFEEFFKDNLEYFQYRSKGIYEIKISEDKYLPVINGFDMKFDSSASDFIRALWSYFISLYQVSDKKNLNHSKLLIFDEPFQQQINKKSSRKLLERLSNLNGKYQVIISTSVGKNEFSEITNDINFKLIEIEKYFLVTKEDKDKE